MKILFRISRWALNIVGMLALIGWLISVGSKVNFNNFVWNDWNSIQFIVGLGLLLAYFALGIIGIIFKSAKKLKMIISFIFCIIGVGSLGLAAYNTGVWIQNNNAWIDFKDKENGLLNICIFSISVGLIGSYLVFGPLILLSKLRKK